MESRKMVAMNLLARRQEQRASCGERTCGPGVAGRGEGGANWESSTDTYALSMSLSLQTVSDSVTPRTAVWLTGLLCPWNFPGKNTGVGCHFLLQRIFPDQGWTLSILTLSRDPSWDPSWKTKTLLSLREFQGFRSSSPGTWHIDQSNSLLCNLHPQPVVKSMPAAHELVIALPPGTLFILCRIQSSVW